MLDPAFLADEFAGLEPAGKESMAPGLTTYGLTFLYGTDRYLSVRVRNRYAPELA